MDNTTNSEQPEARRSLHADVSRRLEIREQALRDIKAVHTRWYHHGAITAEDAAREMEEIAVSVWQRESANVKNQTPPPMA